MKKNISVFLIISVLSMMLLSSCGKEKIIEIKTSDVSTEEVNLYEEYKNYSISEKQIFNYFVNGNYKYYDYEYFRRPIDTDKSDKVVSICESLLNKKICKANICILIEDINDKEKYKDEYPAYGLNLLSKDDSIKNIESNKIKSQQNYIDTLNLMYKDIEGFNDLNDIQKYFFSHKYNQMYVLLPESSFIGEITCDELKKVSKLCSSLFVDWKFNEGTMNKHGVTHTVCTEYKELKITEENFNRIYSHFIDDYKNFYKFLGKTIDNKGKDKKEYKFEKPVYYDFAEYMVNLFFEMEDKFELYQYTFDDCGMVTGFKWTNLDEVIEKCENEEK